jgi:error-prone DNA polymerase
MRPAGRVVEDYQHAGLTLRAHPVSFLCDDLAQRRIANCVKAVAAKGSTWLETAGLILVRQRPGSAKGVLFFHDRRRDGSCEPDPLADGL